MLILCLLNTCVQARWRIQARAPEISGRAVDREGTQFQSARQPAQRNVDTMPVGLGLEVPDWGDDSGAWAAPAKLKPSSDKPKRNLVPSPVSLKTEPKAGKGTASAKRATTASVPAGKPLSSTREDTIVGKKRKLAEAVAAVPEHLRHMLIMPTDDDAETPSVGRSEDGGGSKRKRKKRKGKHSKNKDDKAPTLTQDSSPPPQRVGEGGAGASGGLIDKKKKGKKDEGKKNAAATPPPQKQEEGTAAAKPRPAAELEVHGDGAGTGAPKKKKKRKRKNKFLADQEGGEGAGAKATSEAGGQGGVGAEESRKGDGGGKKRKKATEDQSGIKESPGPGGAKSGGPGKDKSVLQGGKGKPGPHQVEKEAEGQKGGHAANDGAERKFPFKGAGAVAANRRLTPLQAKLAKKLQGAHFRMLNEELYTTPSAAAQAMFDKDPSLFTTYHEGFRSQVSWRACRVMSS